MSNKTKKTSLLVLELLEQNRGSFISGEQIGQSLNISRAAVWKAIKTLQGLNHQIESSTKIGYCLKSSSDVLSVDMITKLLNEKGDYNRPIYYYDEIDSTNRQAKRLALEGAVSGTIVISETQSEGRGRNGKSFYSPKGSGLYLSLLLKPKVDSSIALRVTSAAAVATHRAIRECTNKITKIKWVNDLYLDNLKVCGILTEGISGFESRQIESIVVGVGINFKEPEKGYPDNINSIAGSLFKKDHKVELTRNELAASLILNLKKITDNLEDNSYLKEYRENSLVIGKNVKVIAPNESYTAFIKQIDDNGALIIGLEDGSEKLLQSGEISLRPQDNSSW